MTPKEVSDETFRIVNKMWTDMPEAQQNEWKQWVSAKKDEYKAQMSNYTAPDGFNKEGFRPASLVKQKSKKKGSKAPVMATVAKGSHRKGSKKLPGLPKHPRSACNFFRADYFAKNKPQPGINQHKAAVEAYNSLRRRLCSSRTHQNGWISLLDPQGNSSLQSSLQREPGGHKIYATEIYKVGSIEDMAAMSHELEEAVHEVTLLEADAFGVAMDADQLAESIDAAQHDESTMTIKSAQEIAEVEAKAKAIEEEVEDIAAHALPIMAVEQIASKLEEDKKKAEANEKAKVAADKTHPDPFHHLKSMFGM